MLIYAHRGARSYAPENTMSAFKRALVLGTDGIELDVQLTKDGIPVICHDHNIDRTSTGHGLIKDYSLKQLKNFDFGKWFNAEFIEEQIPSLEEFLKWYTSTSLLLNIEIKNGPIIYEGIEEKVVALLNKHDINDRVIISSFYHPSLLKIKKLNPYLKTGALFECRPLEPYQLALDTKADFLHPYWHSLDKDWAELVHSKGIGINAYTINNMEELDFVRQFGIDAIFTDYPDKLMTEAHIR